MTMNEYRTQITSISEHENDVLPEPPEPRWFKTKSLLRAKERVSNNLQFQRNQCEYIFQLPELIKIEMIAINIRIQHVPIIRLASREMT